MDVNRRIWRAVWRQRIIALLVGGVAICAVVGLAIGAMWLTGNFEDLTADGKDTGALVARHASQDYTGSNITWTVEMPGGARFDKALVPGITYVEGSPVCARRLVNAEGELRDVRILHAGRCNAETPQD